MLLVSQNPTLTQRYHHLARNLKFYPLALRNAVKDFGPLSFIGSTFAMETCGGAKKLFKDLSKWELLNLKVSTVLEIPDRLSIDFGISSTFLQDTMEQYGIQSVGLGPLERQYDIDQPIQYMLSSTRHYSWPKGGGEYSSLGFRLVKECLTVVCSHCRHRVPQCGWDPTRYRGSA